MEDVIVNKGNHKIVDIRQPNYGELYIYSGHTFADILSDKKLEIKRCDRNRIGRRVIVEKIEHPVDVSLTDSEICVIIRNMDTKNHRCDEVTDILSKLYKALDKIRKH